MFKYARWNKLAALALVALSAAGCATVPVTGRSQLALLPASQLNALAVDSYQQVLSESQLSNDQEKVAMVQRVGQRIASAAEAYMASLGVPAQGFAWEFNLIEDDEMVNAWCMPGGKIAVYTGILPITKNEPGLAVVMGHEVAHALANHGGERMSQALLVEVGAQSLNAALSSKPEQTRTLFNQAYGAVTGVGVLLPYSRMHESEADKIGLHITALAGYDPRASIPLWRRMAAQGGSRPPAFLSTHPDPLKRIERLKAEMPEAMALYRQQGGRG